MDNNKNCDNSFELYARYQATRNTPASNDAANTGAIAADAIDSTPPSTGEFNPPISIISDPQRNASQASRAPSIKFKLNRKRSQRADSDATDRSDASGKTTTTIKTARSRNTLTSSFLRRKQMEYAGIYAKVRERENESSSTIRLKNFKTILSSLF